MEGECSKWKDSARMAGMWLTILVCVASTRPTLNAGPQAGPCGFTANVISAHLNAQWPPGMFSLGSSSWFACFLPARSLCSCTFPSGCASPLSSSFDCQTRRRSLFSPPRASSRIQSLPGAQGSALPTHAHSLLLLFIPDSSTDSQLFPSLSPSSILRLRISSTGAPLQKARR